MFPYWFGSQWTQSGPFVSSCLLFLVSLVSCLLRGCERSPQHDKCFMKLTLPTDLMTTLYMLLFNVLQRWLRCDSIEYFAMFSMSQKVVALLKGALQGAQSPFLLHGTEALQQKLLSSIIHSWFSQQSNIWNKTSVWYVLAHNDDNQTKCSHCNNNNTRFWLVLSKQGKLLCKLAHCLAGKKSWNKTQKGIEIQ